MGGALRAISFLRLLRRHDEDGVLPTVSLIQIHQPDLLGFLYAHLDPTVTGELTDR